jgi:DNA-binding MarR family transcriptional regulator
MNQHDFVDLLVTAERLHRQFLEVIQLELDRLCVRDINNIRALTLLNIGDAEMTASELLWRGCYLGSNVSYNLKKLTEAGYVIQERSKDDGRVIMVRNSEKGMALCGVLREMNERHIAAFSHEACKEEDLISCRQTLRTLHRFLSRAADAKSALSMVTGAALDRAAAIRVEVPGAMQRRAA